ncbi:MAG: hypothetical protein K6F04_01490 [bacterium]|nr:hypothetical protein [bacterium]
MLKTKNYLLLITSFMLCGEAYAQTSNMMLPQQVGVYSANSANASQMRLPPQVGMYQRNNGRYYANPYTVTPTKTVVDYSRYPTMNQNVYENVNGYQSPNKYVLQSPSVQARAKELAKDKNTPEEFGTEYYLALSYGFGSFDGEGLVNTSNNEIPLNSVSEGLGDPKVLSIGFGVMQNRDTRFDISYVNISGLKFDSTSYSENQWCGPTDVGDDFYYDCSEENSVSGGGIKSNALMFNVQLSLTDLFGKLFDGMVVPYVGAGVGFAFNTLSDYTVYDEYGTAEIPLSTDGTEVDEEGNYLTGNYEYDGTITHFGAMTDNIAWSLEAGVSINLDRTTSLDVYYKMANYGSVKSKDIAYYSYGTVDILDPIDDAGTCAEGFEYNEDTTWCEAEAGTSEGYTTDATEKGKIETTEIGVKLRLIF